MLFRSLQGLGYPDVQAFMKTYRKAEAIVTQYNQDLAEWEQAVKDGQKFAEKQCVRRPGGAGIPQVMVH